jgi:predicted enzyme related to lactoylglutathione lyase
VGERTQHPPGTFSWTDLGTTDADGAKAFYSALCGWELTDEPVADGSGTVYTMARIDGKAVCALYRRGPEQQGPPAWLSYITVEDADATTTRAIELGASVLMDPFDVLTVGRMALLADPTGAVFAVWQPRDSIGAELVNDPGAMCLNQLNTDDPSRAQDFYSGLFGWRVEESGTPEQEYWGLYNGERLNGGMMPLPTDTGAPSHWLVYFTSIDLDGDADRITELGGTMVVPPTPVPGGRIAVAQDPQGAAFALLEGRVDP